MHCNLIYTEAPTYTNLVQRAMREGSTKVLIVKALIIGPPGSPNTDVKVIMTDDGMIDTRNY